MDQTNFKTCRSVSFSFASIHPRELVDASSSTKDSGFAFNSRRRRPRQSGLRTFLSYRGLGFFVRPYRPDGEHRKSRTHPARHAATQQRAEPKRNRLHDGEPIARFVVGVDPPTAPKHPTLPVTSPVLFPCAHRIGCFLYFTLNRHLDWGVPDYSTLSRRQKTLSVASATRRSSAGPTPADRQHRREDAGRRRVEDEVARC